MRTGINLVQQIWPVDENVTYEDSKVQSIDHETMKRSFVAARKSQRRVHDVSVTGSASGYGQNIQLYKNAHEGKIMEWLREIRTRKVDNRRVLNKSQFRVVKKVAKRICLEYRALAGGMRFEDLPEPLRWCMHGGPGTGKTHVIKIIRISYLDEFLVGT